MLHHNLKQMYVVDRDGKLVGMVKKKFLEEAIRQGSEDLSSVMLQNFPKASANISLENIFHLYQQGLTVGSMSPMLCPHPLTPSPTLGRRGTGSLAPLSLFLGEGLGVRACGLICKGDMLP